MFWTKSEVRGKKEEVLVFSTSRDQSELGFESPAELKIQQYLFGWGLNPHPNSSFFRRTPNFFLLFQQRLNILRHCHESRLHWYYPTLKPTTVSRAKTFGIWRKNEGFSRRFGDWQSWPVALALKSAQNKSSWKVNSATYSSDRMVLLWRQVFPKQVLRGE